MGRVPARILINICSKLLGKAVGERKRELRVMRLVPTIRIFVLRSDDYFDK